MINSAFSLIVFDLDLTLWDCGGTWCDCLSPPFSRDNDGRVWDSDGTPVRLYPDCSEILAALETAGTDLALASRTSAPPWARELLDLLGIRNLFQYEEIYPGDKTAHFRALREKSGVPFSEMLFFDDERRNIDAVSALGVTCVHVTRGLDWPTFEKGAKKAPARNRTRA